jgi:hypothetical protein
LRSDCGGGT